MEQENPSDMPCYCGRCTCNKHKCPSRQVQCKYPAQYKTTYQQDFIKQPLGQSGEFYNVNKARREYAPFRIESASSYKMHYPGYAINARERNARNRSTLDNIPFSASTSYQEEFIKYGSSELPPSKIERKQYTIPFEGKSVYSEAFVPMDLKARAQPMKSV
jgi:hypothetical protein